MLPPLTIAHRVSLVWVYAVIAWKTYVKTNLRNTTNKQSWLCDYYRAGLHHGQGPVHSPVPLTQNIHLNLYSSLVDQGAIDTGNTWNVTSVVFSLLLALFMAHNYNQGGSGMQL